MSITSSSYSPLSSVSHSLRTRRRAWRDRSVAPATYNRRTHLRAGRVARAFSKAWVAPHEIGGADATGLPAGISPGARLVLFVFMGARLVNRRGANPTQQARARCRTDR